MRKATLLFIIIAASSLLIGCNAILVKPDPALQASPETAATDPTTIQSPPPPTVSNTPPPEPSSTKIRLSEVLYSPDIPLTGWKPYFTGEEPEWEYNPDEPWLWILDGENSPDQTPANEAHMSLYEFLESYANYAGCYVNSNGYLTVMLTDPTMEQADELASLSAAPIWIVSANFPYSSLVKALDEVFPAITAWMEEHPEAPIGGLSGGVRDNVNRVYLSLSGSGIPKLLDAFDFPPCIELEYKLTIDPSQPHEIPHAPVTSWEKDGVTIRSAQESYPIGTTSIPVTVSHEVPNMRLYAPDSLLSVDKYVNGDWYDVSGNFFMNAVYMEILDIPAGVEKTVYLTIVTPETLGPGLYRAKYGGHVSLSSTGDTTAKSAIAGISGKDYVNFEFIIASDAEGIFPADQAKAYMEVFNELYELDPGLNNDITYLALDLTDVLLKDTEPLVALVQRFCNGKWFFLLLDTFEGLIEKGYVADLYFKDGILISFRDIVLSENELVTSAQKWRSGLGAIGADYTVVRRASSWEITETGNQWIS